MQPATTGSNLKPQRKRTRDKRHKTSKQHKCLETCLDGELFPAIGQTTGTTCTIPCQSRLPMEATRPNHLQGREKEKKKERNNCQCFVFGMGGQRIQTGLQTVQPYFLFCFLGYRQVQTGTRDKPFRANLGSPWMPPDPNQQSPGLGPTWIPLDPTVSA